MSIDNFLSYSVDGSIINHYLRLLTNKNIKAKAVHRGGGWFGGTHRGRSAFRNFRDSSDWSTDHDFHLALWLMSFVG